MMMVMVMGMMMVRVLHRSVFHLLRLNLYPNAIRISDDFTCHMRVFTITKRTTTNTTTRSCHQSHRNHRHTGVSTTPAIAIHPHSPARNRTKTTKIDTHANTQPIVVRFYDAFFSVYLYDVWEWRTSGFGIHNHMRVVTVVHGC